MNAFGPWGAWGTAAAFLIALLTLAWLRRYERRWIARRFPGARPVLLSFGVTFFGLASQTGRLTPRRGFLLLLPDRLFFRGRAGRLELDIPGPAITRVSHGRDLRGVDLHQSVIKVDFLSDGGVAETAAFRVPYPPQWMRAVSRTLLTQPAPQNGAPAEK